MASSDYYSFCCAMKIEFEKKFKKRDTDDKFATRSMPKTVLSVEGTLQRFYGILRALESPRNISSRIDETAFIDRIKQRDLYQFLAILLYATCSPQAAQDFVEKLVVERETVLPKLPTNENNLKRIFSKPQDAHLFHTDQRYFCTVVVGGSKIISLQENGKERLPWTKVEEIHLGTGSFGQVFKVTVAEGHLRREDDINPINATAQVIARKDFIRANIAKKSFEKEVENIQAIYRSRARHENILMSLGYVVIEGTPPKFSLLMPWASETLQEYMQESNDYQEISAKKMLIDCAIGLSHGLHFLHTELESEKKERVVFYHLDLKPANILVFKDTHRRQDTNETFGGNNMVWKISDFGMSRIKTKTTRYQTETDLRLLFRTNSLSSEATGTQNERGIGTFLPCEAESPGREMNEKSDVRSLGCIISILFTFMDDGSRGIREYIDLRKNCSNMTKDTFYGKHSFFRSWRINQGVKTQHSKLIKAAGKRDLTEKKVVKHMLGFLEDKVFVIDQRERCDAKTVCEGLKEAYQIYCGRDPRETPRSVIVAKNTDNDKSVARYRLNVDGKISFDGCESSPDGKFIAYWNSRSILLFTMAGHQKAGEGLLNPAKLSRDLPTSPHHYWKTVKLTNSYLIAATTGGTFNCYIFDIERTCDLSSYQVAAEPRLPEVYMLATSPIEDSFFCILANGVEGHSFVASAKIRYTFETSGTVSEETSSGNGTNPRIKVDYRMKLPFEWSTTEILHMMLQTETKGFMAIRPRGNMSILKVFHFSIDPSRIASADLKLQYSDNTNARTFTDMACFGSNRNGHSNENFSTIVALQAISLSLLEFSGLDNKPKEAIQHRVKGYNILKVATDGLGTVLALGTRSDRRTILLLDIKLPSYGGDDTVRSLKDLRGLSDTNHPKLRIYREGSNRTIALVTALTPVSGHLVYEIDVSELSSN